MKRFLVLCLVLMLSGCVKEEKTVKRAVFAWNGVETKDRVILDKYQIDTIFMDINHFVCDSYYYCNYKGKNKISRK